MRIQTYLSIVSSSASLPVKSQLGDNDTRTLILPRDGRINAGISGTEQLNEHQLEY
jgi:hypothetical protein